MYFQKKIHTHYSTVLYYLFIYINLFKYTFYLFVLVFSSQIFLRTLTLPLLFGTYWATHKKFVPVYM